MGHLASGPGQALLAKSKSFKVRAFEEMKSWQLTIPSCISVGSSLTAYVLGHIRPLYVEGISSSEVFLAGLDRVRVPGRHGLDGHRVYPNQQALR